MVAGDGAGQGRPHPGSHPDAAPLPTPLSRHFSYTGVAQHQQSLPASCSRGPDDILIPQAFFTLARDIKAKMDKKLVSACAF